MTTELYHHGILGQKWGKKNGPPYPLGSGDHSVSEKKAGWKRSLGGGRNESEYGRKRRGKESGTQKSSKSSDDKTKKFVRNLLIAGGVTLAVAGGVYLARKHYVNNYVDTVLKSDVTLQTMKARIDDFAQIGQYNIYATYEPNDKEKYLALYGKNLFRRNKDLQEIMKLKINLKNEGMVIASRNSAAKAFTGYLSQNPGAKDKIISELQNNFKTFHPKRTRNRDALLRTLYSGKISDTKLYDCLNLAMAGHDNTYLNDTFANLFGILKKQGYSAVKDLNDSVYGFYNAKAPLIVFGQEKIKDIMIEMVNKEQVNANFNKQLMDSFVKNKLRLK